MLRRFSLSYWLILELGERKLLATVGGCCRLLDSESNPSKVGLSVQLLGTRNLNEGYRIHAKAPCAAANWPCPLPARTT